MSAAARPGRKARPGPRGELSGRPRKPGAAPLHVLVTAGPTREAIDPVRFLSNESSGRMGFAIAAAAARAGCRVTLVAGPVHLPTPAGVERVDVESARQMLAAARGAFREADVLFMTAAVADFRPARRLSGKWRKKDDGSERAILRLVRNPDILATLGRSKKSRLLVGFALETGQGRERALAKLRRKNLDYIVLNDDSALNAELSTVTVFGEDGTERHLTRQRKERIAQVLVELAIVGGRGRRPSRG